MPPYQRLKSERGPDLGIFKIRIDHQKNNRNQHVLKAVVLEAADSANVVAITPNKEIILVRQFRFGIGRETLEIPGGMVDKGEDLFPQKDRRAPAFSSTPHSRESQPPSQYDGRSDGCGEAAGNCRQLPSSSIAFGCVFLTLPKRSCGCP